eukprot:1142169-Karenia_brevis.AAC.1
MQPLRMPLPDAHPVKQKKGSEACKASIVKSLSGATAVTQLSGYYPRAMCYRPAQGACHRTRRGHYE